MPDLSALTAILSDDERKFVALIGALRSPGVIATHPGPARLPTGKLIGEHFGRLLAGWIPHVFTPEETHAVRLEGLRYMVIALHIEQVQRDIHPRKLPAIVKAQLVFARQSYAIRYFRTFRVNDLPTENFSNILRFVIWDQTKHPIDARLRITWTCRRWREIALADSTLWNAIWFRGAGGAGGSQIERAWAWFDRAREAPLDIRIDTAPTSEDSDSDSSVSEVLAEPAVSPNNMHQMILRLFNKLSTIRVLIVVVDDWESALTVLELLAEGGPAGMPTLERFELHRAGTQIEDRNSITWPAIVSRPFLGGAVAPSLAYLSVNGVPINWSRSVLENLTTLDIRRLPSSYSPDAVRFREILGSCPRLDKLSLDGAGPKFEQSLEKIQPIQLPYLRTLVIADFTCPYAIFLFSQFSAPGVNDLTLMNLCREDFTPLFLQLTSTFPKVRLLTTYSIQISVGPSGIQIMRSWLESMPLLVYLRIANVANQFFETFFRTDADGNSTPVVPGLAFMDCQSLDPSVVVKFTKDLHRLGKPLQKIYVSPELGERLDPEQIKVLTSLCVLAKLPKGATTPEEEVLTHLVRLLGLLVHLPR
ncbi:hypothetical protein B0H17DRAFT_437887 [Mycena rosella]|uniref:F-box domain-containing protein n=1 Tax=Mycena rosella TaxID=1033263 RepID=A0AAD7CDN2_MYCRO|nr:hypothetical protein B0H17DRAFT_437887 [Mycena rosella]